MKSFGMLFIAAMAALMVIAYSGTTLAQQSRVIKGTLLKVEDPQPRSPGWRVELDEPVLVGKEVLTSVEVDSKDTDLSTLEGRKVVATGTFVQWRTPERGSFIVLNICEINQMK